MTGDIGPVGENVLRLWASQAGLVCNAAVQDKAGWDFLLEWPVSGPEPAGLSLPLDRRPGPLQCFVQVKATTGRPKGVDVKLSNWHRFVHSPVPCFFLVLGFDAAATCRRAFLVHVDAGRMHGVLHRLRTLTARHRHVALHRHTHALTWTPDDALTTLDGAGLRARIESLVGPDLTAYHRAKAAVAEGAGYEGGRRHVHATVRPPRGWAGNPRDLMLDFQLGLVSHLEVLSAEVFDTRFGIDVPAPGGALEGSVLETTGVAPVGRAHLRLRAPDLARDVGVELVARVATDDAEGRDPRTKARFSALGVDVGWHLGDGNLALSVKLPDVREAHALGDLHPVAACVGLLDAAHHAGAVVDVDLRFGGTRVASGSLGVPAAVARPMAQWAALVRTAWTVARAAGLPDALEVRVRELARSETPLLIMTGLLEPDRLFLRAETTITSPTDPDQPWCFPVAGEAVIGTATVRIAGGLFGQPAVVGTNADGAPRYRMDASDVRAEAMRVYPDGEHPEESLAELLGAVTARHVADMNVVGIMDEDGEHATVFVPRAE